MLYGQSTGMTIVSYLRHPSKIHSEDTSPGAFTVAWSTLLRKLYNGLPPNGTHTCFHPPNVYLDRIQPFPPRHQLVSLDFYWYSVHDFRQLFLMGKYSTTREYDGPATPNMETLSCCGCGLAASRTVSSLPYPGAGFSCATSFPRLCCRPLPSPFLPPLRACCTRPAAVGQQQHRQHKRGGGC